MAITTKRKPAKRDAPPPNPRYDLRTKAAKAATAKADAPAVDPLVLDPGANITSDPILKELVQQHVDALEKAKALMDKADVLLDSILARAGSAKVVQLDKGKVGVIVDQFEKGNVQWRSHSLRRYVVTVFGGAKKSQEPPPG